MRFSPFGLAALTASAALALANPTKAQAELAPEATSLSDSATGEASSPAAETASGAAAFGSLTSGQVESIMPAGPNNQPASAPAGPEAAPAALPQASIQFGQADLPTGLLAPVAPNPTPIAQAAAADASRDGADPQFSFSSASSPLNLQSERMTAQSDPSASPAEPSLTEPLPGEPSPEQSPEQSPNGQSPNGQSPNGQSPEQIAPESSPASPPAATPTAEPRVLVSEVVVTGATTPELEAEVYNAIRTLPGRTTTRSQLQEDINSVFATGFFSNVQAIPEDTPLGVRVTFAVTSNPTLSSVVLRGSLLSQPDEEGNLPLLEYRDSQVTLPEAVDQIFATQRGQTANLRALQIGIEQLNKLYQDNGYVLAQVISAPEIDPQTGVATLDVAEGEIENIDIRFLNKDGEAVNEDGEPIRGRTRPFIITREFQSEPGDVFNQNQIQRDLQRAFGLGIFEDLNIALNPGQDPRKVNVVINTTERRTGSLAASAGVSSTSGLFGAVSLQEQNLGGNNQRLNAEIQVGQRDILFDLSFTDPWIATDPYRTSYTVNAFGRQSISLVFDGGKEEITLPNGDRPRIRRFGGGVSFTRPLENDWRASLGLQFQNISVRDNDGTISPRDEFGNLLSFSRTGTDNVATVQFSASQDRRNDPAQTTSGSVLRLSTEQALGIDSIFYNRLRGSYSYYIPVRLIRFTEGCQKADPSPSECPQTLAFNAQGGTILGDFPPYEAFSLGGTDSVRGYDAGELGSGKSYLQGTIEYRFPVFNIVSGALFLDAGSDIGSGSQVQGDPAGIREKPGSGFGYGVGIRVQSPLGQIRVDYAINDDGENRIHFGIGERF
jgi:outer membrane protein insertion porin family